MDATRLSAKQVWHATLERVRERVTSASYATWFKATEGWEYQKGALVVTAPNGFACAHLQQRFSDTARACVAEILGNPLDVRFIVRPHEHARAVDAEESESVQSQGFPRGQASTAEDAEARRPHEHRVSAKRAARQPHPVTHERAALAVTPHAARGGRDDAARRAALAAQPPLITDRAPTSPRSDYTSSVAIGSARPTLTRGTAALSGPNRMVARAERTTAVPFSADPLARHVFDTFVVGTANRLAHAAAIEVARTPGQSYNPLFIYGGTGLGKTHLLLAVGHESQRRGLSVCYVTAERFANDIIEAIRHHTTEEFRAYYRAVDVLLVDDVQFIAGKESTEEEFFHTFNTLHESNRQIVLSSDRVPRAMRHLHDRLRSRFEWGLLADVSPPDLEHRVAILRAKAKSMGAQVTDALLEAIARPDCVSVRELEGALNRVLAYASMIGTPIDEDVVASALGPLRSAAPREVTRERVLAVIARHFGVTQDALSGKARGHAVAWPRQVAMYLMREATPLSLSQIGDCLGGRDHTTVMHGCAHVAAEAKAKAHVRQEVDDLLARLRD